MVERIQGKISSKRGDPPGLELYFQGVTGEGDEIKGCKLQLGKGSEKLWAKFGSSSEEASKNIIGKKITILIED